MGLRTSFSAVRKTTFGAIYTKNDHFTKTGSGQTWERLREKGVYV
jgi:hypothetical protein